MADRGRGRGRGQGPQRGRGNAIRGGGVAQGSGTYERGRGGDRGNYRGGRGSRGLVLNQHGTEGWGVEVHSNLIGGSVGRGRGRGRGPIQTIWQPGFPVPPAQPLTWPDIRRDVVAIGMKRRSYGRTGDSITLWTNSFRMSPPTEIIYHYLVSINGRGNLPKAFNRQIIQKLQTQVAPSIFTPHDIHDGTVNLYSVRRLPLGEADTMEFLVDLDASPRAASVKVTFAGAINPEAARKFLSGQRSYDAVVESATKACEVAINMQPCQKLTFSGKTFFTNEESQYLGRGLSVWKGYIQSLRPSIGSFHIQIDTTNALFYKPGPLIDLCLDFFGRQNQNPARLLNKDIPPRQRHELTRFLRGLRISIRHLAGKSRTIKGLSLHGADQETFQKDDGAEVTIAQYFSDLRIHLTYPGILCVKSGSKGVIPMELCIVPPGEIMRRQVPFDLSGRLIEFSHLRPSERIQRIASGVTVLGHSQSEYLRAFGITVESIPTSIHGRILPSPMLQYGQGVTFQPNGGMWNMIGKQVHTPAVVRGYCIIVYEPPSRFLESHIESVHRSLVRANQPLGIGALPPPYSIYRDGTGDINSHIQAAALDHNRIRGTFPNLFIFILPESNSRLYLQLKHCCDIRVGVVSQCLKASRCLRGNIVYYTNVCLKINAKLGGINSVLRSEKLNLRSCLALGACLSGRSPGVLDSQPFAALVGNTDDTMSKYISTVQPHDSGSDVISDLAKMTERIVTMYHQSRQASGMQREHWPQSILYFRTSLSGPLSPIIDDEVPLIQEGCRAAGIPRVPRITVIVVSQQQRTRFFPQRAEDADPGGNMLAGTVIDRDITSPAESDFLMQSHRPTGGTGLSAHYTVLLDQNKFGVDRLQQICFSLCHSIARSTRSVSLPAPLYYANLASRRAKDQCSQILSERDERQLASSSSSLPDAHQTDQNDHMQHSQVTLFPVHRNIAHTMYFS